MELYDIIGDIHGRYNDLVLLLGQLGYKQGAGSSDHFFHPDRRKVLFVGDYIDRGPDNLRVLALVKKMADAGTAFALMGNHEYNCLAWHTIKDSRFFEKAQGDYKYLRPHTHQNRRQAQSTLSEFKEKPAQKDFFLKWMKKLPLFFEADRIRAVHACWDTAQIQFLRENLPGRYDNGVYGVYLNDEFFQKSWKINTSQYKAAETVLKGREGILPEGVRLRGTDSIERPDYRTKWWLSPDQILKANNLDEIGLFENGQADKIDNPNWLNKQKKILSGFESYNSSEKPLFIGHYWLKGKPAPLSNNIACVDYSGDNYGKLTGYRWSGENELSQYGFFELKNKRNH